MLQSLHIRNLALLDEVALDFEPGFTAVTGETGAGKSILLGALNLLAGSRADKSIIRQGAEYCEAEAALFFADATKINAVLAGLDLPPCEEGLLLLKRSLARDKAPKITVNGGLATLTALQTLGEHWIDFHGPGEPRRLLKESSQLELLDAFGHCQPEWQVYQTAYQAWRDLLAERDRLRRETQLSPEELDFLRAQLGKLDALELTPEAIVHLERDFNRLSHAQELFDRVGALTESLSGDEGVQGRVANLLREARQLEELDPASTGLAERLQAVAVELNDLGAEFARLGGQVNFDPEQAEQLQAGMDVWLGAKRKYGGELATVLAARDDMRRRITEQGDIKGALQQLEKQMAAAEKNARRTAGVLREKRAQAARKLTRAAGDDLAGLGFKKTEFQVVVHPLDELRPTGDCGVEFLFSPNAGEPPLPLARIASSGELARVMLALKTVLAESDHVPLLVFDEVDANVGGEIGRVVGEKLAALAGGHQVLCVTHLPQVAAQAASHLVVTKEQSRDRTFVRITPIHGNRTARIDELARMLGDRQAKSALTHAEALLKPPGV